MPNEVIDLTKSRPTEAFSTFQPSDVVLIAVTGAVGYLAKEAYKYLFPGTPSIIEQITVLGQLIEACGKAGASSVKVRVSSNAQSTWQMPKSVDVKILGESSGTIDLEVVFREPRKRTASTKRKTPTA